MPKVDVEEFVGFPEDITADTILVMVDVDTRAMDEQLRWPRSVQAHYKQFVKGLSKRTRRRIHAYSSGNTVLETWNTKGWETVPWHDEAEDYKKGRVSEDLIKTVRLMGGDTLPVVVFGAMWSDCVLKVANGLAKKFPKVYAWRGYSIDKDAPDTYYVSEYGAPGKVTVLEAKAARDAALKILKEAGIEDGITVKVRPFTGEQEHWLALYRSLSQFRGRPVIWINENLDDVMEEFGVPEDRRFDILVDDILHEYAHVIAEWGRKGNSRITELIQQWGTEEDFAEAFVDAVKDHPYIEEPFISITDLFKKDVFDAPDVSAEDIVERAVEEYGRENIDRWNCHLTAWYLWDLFHESLPDLKIVLGIVEGVRFYPAGHGKLGKDPGPITHCWLETDEFLIDTNPQQVLHWTDEYAPQVETPDTPPNLKVIPKTDPVVKSYYKDVGRAFDEIAQKEYFDSADAWATGFVGVQYASEEAFVKALAEERGLDYEQMVKDGRIVVDTRFLYPFRRERFKAPGGEPAQEEAREFLREHLEAMVKMRKALPQGEKPEGWEYNSIEEFVLRNGRWYTPAPLPKNLKRGRMMDCFKNATHAMERGYTYVEGYATGIVPVLHAWVTDDKGNAYDVTWPYNPKNAYYGVPFDKMFVIKTMLRTGVYGILDDWRSGWPLLSGESKPEEYLHREEVLVSPDAFVCNVCGATFGDESDYAFHHVSH